ncbi:MAG TPA: lipid A biosynthesis acyltransferase [Cytophagales bacterium]|nr:lipid A biosynthesis acyltransferase [Cytophagales bacterium]HRG07778.1 lipid A biosynthesis acyltransferase [Cyclobacteriaceae bacterium]
MPAWQGKSRGTKLGYSIFVALCKNAGLLPGYALLRFVALYYFLFSLKSSKHIYQYFRLRQGYSKVKALFSVYTNYYRFGQTLLDKIVIMAGIQNKFTYHFDGEENLLAIASQKKGGILLSAHVGNWEVAGHFLERIKTTMNVVMFDGEHQQIKDYLQQVTGNRKFNAIVIKEDFSHVYAIGEALQKNEMVCIHADRFMDITKTTPVRFLGEEALFPNGPFTLAAAFHVPVSIVYAFKETNKHYHFFGSKPISRTEDESKQAYTQRLMQLYVSELEVKMKTYPEQWFNYYNFWEKK